MTSFSVLLDGVPAPEDTYPEKAEQCREGAEQDGTRKQRQPDVSQRRGHPGEGPLHLAGHRRFAENPCAQEVTHVEHGRHGHGIGDPYQCHGNRQVNPPDYGASGRGEHLQRHRDHRPEQSYGEGAGYGSAVQVPKIAIVQQGAEHGDVLVILNRLAAREIAFDEMFRHSAKSTLDLIFLATLTVAGFSDSTAILD